MTEEVVLMSTCYTKSSEISAEMKVVLRRITKVNGVVEYVVHYDDLKGARYSGFYSFSPKPAIEEFNRRVEEMWRAW